MYLLGERSDVHALMQLANFIVLSSENEGLSNTLLEGMINGRLVIASDIPGNAEVIQHNQNGALFEPDDDEQLANIMHRAIEEPSWARRLGNAAHQEAEARFSVPVMAESFMQHYLSTRQLLQQA